MHRLFYVSETATKSEINRTIQVGKPSWPLDQGKDSSKVGGNL